MTIFVIKNIKEKSNINLKNEKKNVSMWWTVTFFNRKHEGIK